MEMLGIQWPFGNEEVSFYIDAGLSARQADLDNIIKPLLDTFQGIFEEFNDNKVYHIEATKEIVKRGDEYIRVRVRRSNTRILQAREQEAERTSKERENKETTEQESKGG